MKGKKTTLRETLAKIKTDSTLRAQVFKQLCEHIAQGYSIESFGVLSNDTIEKYFNEYPSEFVREEYSYNLAKGRAMWEQIGKAQAKGECLGNSRTWFYNMSQRYGWSERSKIETDQKHSVNVNVINYASKKGSTT